MQVKRLDTRKKIVRILVEELSVEIDDIDKVDYDMELFSEDEGEGFGLDSVDALELIVAVENDFGIELKNVESMGEILKSINSLSSYIDEQEQRNEKVAMVTEEISRIV